MRTSSESNVTIIAYFRDVLEDYEKKMRDAENESHEGKRKVESVW